MPDVGRKRKDGRAFGLNIYVNEPFRPGEVDCLLLTDPVCVLSSASDKSE